MMKIIILGPSRGLVYWSMFLPVTVSIALATSKGQIEYFCTHPEAKVYSKDQVGTLVSWWVQVHLNFSEE